MFSFWWLKVKFLITIISESSHWKLFSWSYSYKEGFLLNDVLTIKVLFFIWHFQTQRKFSLVPSRSQIYLFDQIKRSEVQVTGSCRRVLTSMRDHAQVRPDDLHVDPLLLVADDHCSPQTTRRIPLLLSLTWEALGGGHRCVIWGPAGVSLSTTQNLTSFPSTAFLISEKTFLYIQNQRLLKY